MSSPADRRDPWLGIELRHLSALAAIASEGTFSEAALSLGYVQSAISGQVATLERLAGRPLVERSRSPGPQRLTVAGQLLLSHFRSILAELDQAHKRLECVRVEATGKLRVTVADCLPDEVVTTVLSAIGRDLRSPGIGSVHTAAPDAIVDKLNRDDCDVALIALPLDEPGIGTASVARTPLTLVVPADSEWRRARPASLRTVGQLPLIAWREGEDPSRIEREFAELGLDADVIIRADTVQTVQQLVAMRFGAAVLPCGWGASDPRLAAVELDAALPDRVMGIAWRRERSADRRLRRVVDVSCRLRDRESKADREKPPIL